MGQKFFSAVLSLLVITPFLAAKKQSLPEQIVNARSVAIMFLSTSGPAGDVNTPGLSTQDRAALTAVETAFRKWNRYSVTIDPRQAELIVAVRTAQQVVSGGAGMGNNSGSRTRRVIFGADLGPNVDMIQIYSGNMDLPDRSIAGPLLWTGAERDGLVSPGLPLLQRFKQEVEEAAKRKK